MLFVKQSQLRSHPALRYALAESTRSIPAARAEGRTTIFLSHSHEDRALALGLKAALRDQDLSLYIDWEDSAMPSQTNEETARRIQTKIRECHLFLFLATQNSLPSRWCPWEIGYADATKTKCGVVIVPTVDDNGDHHGNEYLLLYNYLELSPLAEKYHVIAAYHPGGILLERYAASVR